jgi:hypothetical protein
VGENASKLTETAWRNVKVSQKDYGAAATRNEFLASPHAGEWDGDGWARVIVETVFDRALRGAVSISMIYN